MHVKYSFIECVYFCVNFMNLFVHVIYHVIISALFKMSTVVNSYYDILQ